jgi:transposase InsO family protein
VVIEGRRQVDVARDYHVSKGWVSKLVARHRVEGDAAMEPRSRKPRTRPGATAASTVEVVVGIRQALTAQGLDAGADTIGWHLQHHHRLHLSRATIYRIVRRAELIVPEPAKRPKSSYIRFQADLPNECWQADFTHHRLADSTDSQILCWIDDHSRYAISVTAHRRVTAATVVNAFTTAVEIHGIPSSTLTDNGMVFTTRRSGGRGGRNAFEHLLDSLGVTQKNSRPNHPTTCGKVERFHQTLKKWLRAQPPPATITQLPALLDVFVDTYNHRRPHRSLHGHTPAAAYQARPKTTPTGRHNPHLRVRRDRINTGNVTVRLNGQLHHIGLGRTLDRTPC